jgi:predicted Zn-dependent peptidase
MEINCMEIRKNRRLYLINKSNKKGIIVWIMFYFPLDKNASLNALLSKILLKGSSNYSTSRIISRILYENYGASFGSDINLKGECYTLSFYSDFINPSLKIIDRNLVSNILNITKDVIYNPLFENGQFTEKYFTIEKENLRNDIKNKINDKGSYALNRCIEIMCREEPYSIDKLGCEEWVNEAELKGLTARYFDIIRSYPLSIYVMGDISDEIADNIKELFPEYDAEQFQNNIAGSQNNSVKEIDEEFDVEQSRFCFGFRTGTNLNSDDYPALVLLNNILGGGPSSILFNQLREKRSLCYGISSSLEKYKELLFVNCGIDKKNKTEVKNNVIEIIERIKNEGISESDYENAMISVRHNMSKLLDDSFYYISYTQGLNIYNSNYTAEGFSKMINSVSKDDIIEVSKKIKLDTIYFLSSRE